MATQNEELRFTAWCSCHAHHALVVELIDWNGEGEWELSVGHTYEPIGSLWDRIKGIWQWLRGKPYYVSEVLLTAQEAHRLRHWLSETLSSRALRDL
jgi:hypothetical protein